MDLNVYTEEDAAKAAATVKADPASPQEIADPDKETPSGKTLTKDDVYGRVLKYVPAPLIGIYLMVTNVIISAGGDNPSDVLLWAAFIFFMGATAAYLVVRKVKRGGQIALSIIAFIAVATASPGPFQQISGWEEFWGTLVLAAAAVLLIVFKPGALPAE